MSARSEVRLAHVPPTFLFSFPLVSTFAKQSLSEMAGTRSFRLSREFWIFGEKWYSNAKYVCAGGENA